MDLFTEEQKISLFFRKENNMVEIICTIDKVQDDRLDLILPQYFMRYIKFLQVGKKLTAKAFSKFGTLDFNTIIISSPLEEQFSIELDLNSIKLTSNKDLPVIKAIEVIEILNPLGNIKLKTFEISTEYIKFYTNEHLNKGDIFEGKLILPKDYGIINFKAEVSEIDPIYDNEITASFITMIEKDRQTLLYYMYLYNKDID